MAARDWRWFIIIAVGALLAMSIISATATETFELPAAYGLIPSASGLAVILFAWHIYIQTSSGGIDNEAYNAKPIIDRLVDFAVVILVSGLVAAVGIGAGIEFGFIDSDVLWGEDIASWVAGTLVLILGMLAGIYAGVARNRDIQITEDDDRGE